MCGIAGWAGQVDAGHEELFRMTAALSHRGPDDAGFHLEPGRVGIGFRRLSIIDLAGGAQPIFDEADRRCVTCNGEIYNFQALRARLERWGHRFATHSDTEVIVHLYEELGVECVRELRGMFAIALWDPTRMRLLLARDRLGVKPLYWAQVPGGIVYGSEPGAILATGLLTARPDPAAIMQYLTLQYVPPPRSGFAGIHKLAPGERLIFEEGKPRVERWWSLTHQDKRQSGRDPVAELDGLLDEATRLRMIADVPLGAFLSGGIDSSLVVSYMAEHASRVHTFSIDFPHDRFSEARHARRVADLYGTSHQDFLVEADMVPAVADAVRFAGEPFADSSAIPTYLLSQLTRRHVTVALSGDGGDEAFAGYVRHRIATVADRAGPIPQLMAPVLRPLSSAASGRAARVARALGAIARSSHDRYAAIMCHFEPENLRALCTHDLIVEAGGVRSAWENVLALPALTGVDRYLALDTATYLPGDLLFKVDRMSMAHALEVRSPLLDHHVQEFGARLPGDLKLRGGTTKWLLKELARRRGLPEDLIARPKMGFGIPVGGWFRGELRPWLEGILRDARTRDRGLLDSREVEHLVADHVTGRADHTPRLWNLAMLELWHRTWIDEPRPPAPRVIQPVAVER
jgi:asparagine synthase (glutamine-hydrolysing)